MIWEKRLTLLEKRFHGSAIQPFKTKKPRTTTTIYAFSCLAMVNGKLFLLPKWFVFYSRFFPPKGLFLGWLISYADISLGEHFFRWDFFFFIPRLLVQDEVGAPESGFHFSSKNKKIYLDTLQNIPRKKNIFCWKKKLQVAVSLNQKITFFLAQVSELSACFGKFTNQQLFKEMGVYRSSSGTISNFLKRWGVQDPLKWDRKTVQGFDIGKG